MNKQGPGGIGWCHYTTNIGDGCEHDCKWEMPDHTVLECYAKNTYERFGLGDGNFAHYVWHPERLKDPGKVKEPSRIFVGSMTDVFGHWVPDEHIQATLQMCRDYPWHTYQFLTKNPARLKHFDFPSNCWVGISAPPTFMWGHKLTREQQFRWLDTSCKHLSACNARVRWLSAEPLSLNLTFILYRFLFDWMVIGAASRGKTYYQPKPEWVSGMVNEAARFHVPVFFKRNLKGNPGADPWLEQFPQLSPVQGALL